MWKKEEFMQWLNIFDILYRPCDHLISDAMVEWYNFDKIIRVKNYVVRLM